jgi:hypothetical protein
MGSYDSFRSSDFSRFFGVREIDSSALPGGRVVELRPGAFQDAIDIIISLDAAGNVRFAALVLIRAWVGGAEHMNPLATDIAASFLSAFASDPDRTRLADLADVLRHSKGASDRVVELQPHATSIAPPRSGDLLRVFLGLEPTFHVVMQDVELTAQNVQKNGKRPHLTLELAVRGDGVDFSASPGTKRADAD